MWKKSAFSFQYLRENFTEIMTRRLRMLWARFPEAALLNLVHLVYQGIFLIEVNLEDMTITLEEEDTAELKEGTYYYEIELVSSNNFHFTAITKTPLKLTTEIEDH